MTIPKDAQAIVAQLNKKHGEGAVVKASDLVVPERFTSGSLGLDIILGGGWPTNQWVEILGEESNGKALAVDTPIPTPGGWTTMGALQPGDQVFGADGRPCLVTFVTGYQYGRTCYEITFSDGSTIVADADHQWSVRELVGGVRRDSRVVTTANFLSADLKTKRHGWRWVIPNHDAVQYPTRDLPIRPYVLGLWLADGSSAKANISNPDAECRAMVERWYLTKDLSVADGKCPEYSVWEPDGARSIYATLREVGVLENKHIPEEYLTASWSQRMELLQGLMDGDGYCQKGLLEYTSVNCRLAEDVLELVRSLGTTARISEGAATINGRYISQKYRVLFYLDENPFKLTRKADAWRPATKSKHRAIVAIREVPSVPVKCIQVDRPDSLYLAGNAYVATHNTAIVLKTIAANQARDPNFTVVWIAAEHYDVDQAEALGVDNDRVIVVPTQEMELAFETLLEFAESKSVDMGVLDSYPALIPSEEAQKTMEDSVVAIGARLFGKFFRKAGGATRRVEGDRPFLGIIINQWRDQIGGYAAYGTPKTSPGGKAKNYAYYVRLEVKRDEYIDELRPGKGKMRVGQVIKLTTKKNKSAPPGQMTSVRFYFRDAPRSGFRRGEYDLVEELMTYGVFYDKIVRRGAYYSIGERRWGPGKDQLLEDLRDDVELQAYLRKEILEAASKPDHEIFGAENAG